MTNISQHKPKHTKRISIQMTAAETHEANNRRLTILKRHQILGLK